jgi:hypothetical protein
MATDFPLPPDERAVNPYAAPATDIGSEAVGIEVGVDLTDAEATRRKYLNHETSIKGIGILAILGGVFALLGGLVFLVSAMRPANAVGDQAVAAFIGVFIFGIGALQILVGSALRQLKNWARWTETVLASLNALVNLIQFNPLPLLFMFYILYLMLSAKGKVVFSSEYKAVIAQTPHIRYKTSRFVKILLYVLVALIVLIIIAAVVSTSLPRR